jgi:nicotinamidase-related amidase
MELQTKKPVLVIIDMLNDYFREGRLAEARTALTTAINQLVAFARQKDFPVIWVRQEFKPDLSDAFMAIRNSRQPITIQGTDGCQILDELNRQPHDHLIIKKRYSAFFGTHFDELLAELQPSYMILAGVNTHACVRMTAVDAYQRDLQVILAVDGINSYDLEYHRVSLRYLSQAIAQVMHNDELIAHFHQKLGPDTNNLNEGV